ncbi:MAG: hypothetical protein JW929_08555 [Anaerolineales bacterium]|nr:hypothetical protein [Anaerolineales bacterium]
MIPTDVFWSQIAAFNSSTWVVQAVWLAAVLAAGCRVFTRPDARWNAALKLLLAVAFLCDGIVFFLVAADGAFYDYFGAPLFILIGALFAADVFRNKIEFRLPGGGFTRGMLLFWILAWLAYPFAGMAFGRTFPRVCTPMDACPLTLLSIALLAAAAPKISRAVFLLLLPWALLALPKALGMYQCYEDGILFLSGVYGVIVLAANWRPRRDAARNFCGAPSSKAAISGRGELVRISEARNPARRSRARTSDLVVKGRKTGSSASHRPSGFLYSSRFPPPKIHLPPSLWDGGRGAFP